MKKTTCYYKNILFYYDKLIRIKTISKSIRYYTDTGNKK